MYIKCGSRDNKSRGLDLATAWLNGVQSSRRLLYIIRGQRAQQQPTLSRLPKPNLPTNWLPPGNTDSELNCTIMGLMGLMGLTNWHAHKAARSADGQFYRPWGANRLVCWKPLQ
jgi:hypothetical protein